VLKKRRELGIVLNNTNQKINDVDLMSKIFVHLKQSSMRAKIVELNEDQEHMEKKAIVMEEELATMKQEKKELYQ
jgi:hypothetical protein